MHFVAFLEIQLSTEPTVRVFRDLRSVDNSRDIFTAGSVDKGTTQLTYFHGNSFKRDRPEVLGSDSSPFL